MVLVGSLGILFLTLFTNQVFHGGLYGKLHNKSVKPKIEISDANIENNILQFEIYRTEGVDVYGSFLIGIQLSDENGNIVLEKTGEELATFPADQILNHYVTKVKPGKHSLIVPLGAKADLALNVSNINIHAGNAYTLKLIDISGLEWESKVQL
ncbi:TQO small subunit DoxA domain-containing protein [Draconibacterium halophilum]|uniref:TQO small subunit DoxA domain-containing protein n=1 Tax=Draconibacterium halophilum TaxID=2706887 RepID=UPI001FEAB2FD|nr:TQO small subunit DoxA domain-containing protein [Draconibacterium halophilum]